MDFRNLSVKELEEHFNPRESVPNFDSYLSTTLVKSQNAKKLLIGHDNINYGNGKLQTLDIYGIKSAKLKPIHIFIHGGYWRALDKSYHNHMAIPFNKNNIIFSNINYDLCPTVSLQIICEQVIEAIIWIYNNCEIYGADKNCITISGHSAGAHLVSYILNLDWEKYNLPYNLFKGAALVSGIYDLEIVRKLTVNDDVRLNAIDAKNLTTINKLPYYKMPIIISYGEDEPLGWKDQSIKYAKFLKKNNFNIDLILCKKNNHFTLIDTLALEESTLCKKIINLSNISNE